MTNLPENRLPPQNIEAEEAILGAILLDPEAINQVADSLPTAAFSLFAHQEIYKATLTLYNGGKPTDLMSVTTWLADRNLLEKVGGQSKLAQLVDRTVSAVNVDQSAALVVDKWMRRQLIHSGHDIAELGYDTATEISYLLDKAEQKIFGLTQERPQVGLVPISETLIDTFQNIEIQQQGLALPGLACGFYDLDALTGGFQRSDLIILAGRPSMGKTSLALNVARNIAEFHKQSVAVFSLEMSKEQLVQRLLSSEAEIESNRLRSGRISQNEWEPLSLALGSLSEMPMFIDDTPNITVTEIRSKCRRLQAEQGGELGLILLDYLQLMEGGNTDNRVQELSKITRSLKGLARELRVPLIALSQLSRSVEARTNKRPMMSDLRECVTGDTLVWLADDRLVAIQELVGQTPTVMSMDGQGRLIKAQTDLVWEVGKRPVYQLTTASGRQIRATGKHRLYAWDGWHLLPELQVGDRLALATIPDPDELRTIVTSELYWDKITRIEPAGEEIVYDLTVPGLACWIGNGIVSHNSGSIEQDADLVIMLYREEYYQPDTPDRGVAEVIITKHRNGPTGTIKLLFDSHLTKFKNLARQTNY